MHLLAQLVGNPMKGLGPIFLLVLACLGLVVAYELYDTWKYYRNRRKKLPRK